MYVSGVKWQMAHSVIIYDNIIISNHNKFPNLIEDCPTGWVFSSDHGSCYLFSSDGYTFDDAVDFCISAKPGYSKVVMLDNDDEDTYLMNYANNSKFTCS